MYHHILAPPSPSLPPSLPPSINLSREAWGWDKQGGCIYHYGLCLSPNYLFSSVLEICIFKVQWNWVSEYTTFLTVVGGRVCLWIIADRSVRGRPAGYPSTNPAAVCECWVVCLFGRGPPSPCWQDSCNQLHGYTVVKLFRCVCVYNQSSIACGLSSWSLKIMIMVSQRKRKREMRAG